MRTKLSPLFQATNKTSKHFCLLVLCVCRFLLHMCISVTDEATIVQYLNKSPIKKQEHVLDDLRTPSTQLEALLPPFPSLDLPHAKQLSACHLLALLLATATSLSRESRSPPHPFSPSSLLPGFGHPGQPGPWPLPLTPLPEVTGQGIHRFPYPRTSSPSSRTFASSAEQHPQLQVCRPPLFLL